MSSVQFRGIAANENGLPYYKTNKGTIIGAILAVPAVAIDAKPLFLKEGDTTRNAKKFYEKYGLKMSERTVNTLKEAEKYLERRKKLAIPFSLITAAVTLGSGILYDKVRNSKAKSAANDIFIGNYKNIYNHRGEVDTTAHGVPVYKSRNAVAFGALTGAICGLVRGVMTCITTKKFHAPHIITPVVLLTQVGMIVSTIAQGASNRAAEKSAYIF